MTTRWVIEERQTTGRHRYWRETSSIDVKTEREARKIFKDIIKQRETGWRARLVRIQEVREVLMTEKY